MKNSNEPKNYIERANKLRYDSVSESRLGKISWLATQTPNWSSIVIGDELLVSRPMVVEGNHPVTEITGTFIFGVGVRIPLTEIDPLTAEELKMRISRETEEAIDNLL